MTDRTYPDDFEAFWKAYAYKRAKPAALKAWKAAIRRASSEEIMAGVERYKAERHNTERCYWKHPATWLNNDCWEDEPIEAPKSKEERADRAADDRTAAFLQRIRESSARHEGNVVSLGTAAKRILADLATGEANEEVA